MSCSLLSCCRLIIVCGVVMFFWMIIILFLDLFFIEGWSVLVADMMIFGILRIVLGGCMIEQRMSLRPLSFCPNFSLIKSQFTCPRSVLEFFDSLRFVWCLSYCVMMLMDSAGWSTPGQLEAAIGSRCWNPKTESKS